MISLPLSFRPPAVVFVLVLGTHLAAQGGAAVWTTDPTGCALAGNLHGGASRVFLAGGPGPNASCAGGGLPDGSYYFQVTDPSGSVLLSSDAIGNREVIVSGGVIVATTGSHAAKPGPCGSSVIKLAPFAEAPFAGDEYRVWLTPRRDYRPGTGFFGFLAACSRTDNFKVARAGAAAGQLGQSIIEGQVFYDYNQNGVLDPEVPFEVPIPGWRVEIGLNGNFDETFTDQDGRYVFIVDQDGTTYDFVEFAPPPGYIPGVGATWLATSPTMGIAVANAENVAAPDFANVQFGLAPGVGRSKGFWHNQGEPLLLDCDPDWRTALGTSSAGGCLRNPLSTTDPALSVFVIPPPPAAFADAFSALSQWIVGLPTEGHAGYQLSTQVAATILNNTCGFMQGTIYVDRFQTGELQSLEGMLAGAMLLLCDPNAGLTGPQDPPFPSPSDPNVTLRDAMQACINEFATINNTGNLLEPQVIFMPQEDRDEFLSPYEH